MRNPRAGFSLVELSIVVVILSIITMLGLEAATSFLSRSAYFSTDDQLQVLDKAIDNFYKSYGYLPCPANPSLGPTNSNYGVAQDCTLATPLGGTSVVAGTIPFRLLNLPASMGIDGFGNHIYYFVTQPLTDNATFAASAAAIEVRSGKLAQPCTGSCSILADPDPSVLSGAAYALLSVGADQRGAISRKGAPVHACAKASDSRIDAQNCYAVSPSGSIATGGIGENVLYDSRYNSGSVDANYFDDAIVWRPKDKL